MKESVCYVVKNDRSPGEGGQGDVVSLLLGYDVIAITLKSWPFVLPLVLTLTNSIGTYRIRYWKNSLLCHINLFEKAVISGLISKIVAVLLRVEENKNLVQLDINLCLLMIANLEKVITKILFESWMIERFGFKSLYW